MKSKSEHQQQKHSHNMNENDTHSMKFEWSKTVHRSRYMCDIDRCVLNDHIIQLHFGNL